MLKAIAFDFDGVLVESVSIKGDAFAALYQDQGVVFQERVLDFHHKNGGMDRFKKIRYYEENFLENKIADDALNNLCDRYSIIVEEKVVQCPWVAGALEFLDKYHKQFPLYVVSATPQEELQRIVKKRKASHFFAGVYGSPKSKTAHLGDIFKLHTLTPIEMVMIGDAMADYDAAKAHSMPFIGRETMESRIVFPEGTIVIKDLSYLSKELGL